MQDALPIVIFAVVGVAAVVAVGTLLVRGAYEQIGRGGLLAEDEASPTTDAARILEIRQMLEARNARRVARGEPPLDVDAEIERRLSELDG